MILHDIQIQVLFSETIGFLCATEDLSLVSDINGENPFSSTDHLQNAQLAAYLYAVSHSPYMPQTSSTTSTYATVPSYHPVPHPPTILSLHQTVPNSTTDTQQSHPAPTLTSPKHDGTKHLLQPTTSVTPKTKPLLTPVCNGIHNDLTTVTQVPDLISSSPALTTSQPAPPSLISPINISTTNAPTTSLSDIWTYTTTGSPLNLTQTAQTAAETAVAAMDLLNNETSQNTEIANEILKELTTPTKQNK